MTSLAIINDDLGAITTVPRKLGRGSGLKINDGYGRLEKVQSRDFLVTAADLVLGGDVTLQQRGDRIRETAGGTVFVHEVMAPGKEPFWRYSDPHRNTLRIHAKQVGAV